MVVNRTPRVPIILVFPIVTWQHLFQNDFLIVNVCAFANRTAKLPQHVGAMSWHQGKFHYFHGCFAFTWIKKLSFSMFLAQPRRPEFWISFPFLAWNLEIYPRTHMSFFNQLWWTTYIVSHSKVARSLSEPRAFLREASVCKSLYQNLFLFGQFFTTTW